jgi:hypothetical protein
MKPSPIAIDDAAIADTAVSADADEAGPKSKSSLTQPSRS